MTFGALCVLKHLLPRFISCILWTLHSYVLCQLTLIFVWRLSEAWYSKRPLLVEAVNSLLDEQSLGVRKALSEVYYKLIAMDIVMALLKDSVLNF